MLRDVTVFTSCFILLLFWQRPANPIAGAADIDRRLTPGRRTIGCGNVTLEMLDPMLLNQADGAAAETGAGQS
jgi:hypothetical protein